MFCEDIAMTRRGALLMGVGAVLGTAAIGALVEDSSPARAAAPTNGLAAGRAATVAPTTARTAARTARLAGVTTKPAPHPAAHAPLPPWGQHWTTAMRRIDDYTRRSPGTRFPSRPVMLTIDDGPSPTWTPRYLQLLARYKIHATFCMIGLHVQAYPALAREVAARGHTIANHTWTHDEQLPYRDQATIWREIHSTSDVIRRATGFVPNQFRAPGGVWGPRVFDELQRQHLMPLGWDIDPRDWALPGTPAITQAMLAARPLDIVLCHDGGGDRSETYAALQTVIPALLRRGYHFVTLPRL